MNRQYIFPALLFILLLTIGSVSALTLRADPQDPVIGEKVKLSGTTQAKNTIAVYLLVTGPGLDRNGVTLENLNLPAGMGYFTSAHVAPDGSFVYEWNTAFIAGKLEPGTYEVYALSIPLNLARIGENEKAKTEIAFLAPKNEINVGSLPVAPLGALPIALFLIFFSGRRAREE